MARWSCSTMLFKYRTGRQWHRRPSSPLFFSSPSETPNSGITIGFLFPGQGSQNSATSTEIAQPATVRDSLAALHELRALGIEAPGRDWPQLRRIDRTV